MGNRLLSKFQSKYIAVGANYPPYHQANTSVSPWPI